MLEIELKVRTDDLGGVRAKLREKGARFLHRLHEHDVYYNAPHRNFAETDEALRIRYSEGKPVVTYKGAKLSGLGLKAREELNTAVESGDVFEEILSRLGFVPAAAVNKWRETYTLSPATITLDEVEGLGTFVEIEVISEGDRSESLAIVSRIKKELGLTGEPILSSYLELILARA